MSQYPLSLNGETFNSMKTDFDMLLRKLLNEMERREEEDATINIKINVHMEKDQARDFQANGYDAMRDIIKPTFKHEISTVLQVKDKKNGTLGGNLEMVWDRGLREYVLRDIDNGQISFADGEKPNAQSGSNVIDVKFCEVKEEQPALQGRKLSALPAPASVTPETLELIRQVAGLCLYVVLDEDDNITLRTNSGVVVLVSDDPNSLLYCPSDVMLAHKQCCLVCHLHPFDDADFDEDYDPRPRFEVLCQDCDEVIFSLDLDGCELPVDTADAAQAEAEAEAEGYEGECDDALADDDEGAELPPYKYDDPNEEVM